MNKLLSNFGIIFWKCVFFFKDSESDGIMSLTLIMTALISTDLSEHAFRRELLLVFGHSVTHAHGLLHIAYTAGRGSGQHK